MTYLMIAFNLVILLKGVQKGIEKVSNVMMPVLFLLLLVFAGVAMTFPKAFDGLAFFLNPDFSKITPGVVINALGQAFFSLSLGMGILITYSGYFPKKTNLASTAVTVAGLDLLVAILMGFIIFPAVMSFGLSDESLEGAYAGVCHSSGGVCAYAVHSVLVGIVLPVADGGGVDINNIVGRGFDSVHAGSFRHEAR